MFLENRLVTPEQIAEVFNITSSELDDIIESFSLQNKIIDFHFIP